MSKLKSKEEFSQFIPQKPLLYFRGLLMLVLGSLISLGSIFAPDVYMMSGANGWLPIAASILIAVGILECFDTYISRHTHRFIVNLQFAVMDSVFGAIILFGLAHDAEKMSLMISAFLIVKGIFRFVAATAGKFPHAKSTIISGLISFLLGILLWAQWPATSVGFLSFCLSLEIALRGWSLLNFANWLGKVAEQHDDLKQH